MGWGTFSPFFALGCMHLCPSKHEFWDESYTTSYIIIYWLQQAYDACIQQILQYALCVRDTTVQCDG